jgi:uncharacterized membrane protein
MYRGGNGAERTGESTQEMENPVNKRSALLAAAAAALFVGGQATIASANHHEAGETVKCDGVNSCKGHSDCKTDHSECNGHNECAGKGWKNMSQAECDAAKAGKADGAE